MRASRTAAAVATSLVLLLPLAGCGGGSSSPQASGSSSGGGGGGDSSGGGSFPPGTTLTYWASNQGTSLDNDREVLTPQLEQFTQQTGVKVDLEVVPWSDLLNRILAAATSGKGPDVLNIGNTWSASLQATGAFLPFDDQALGGLGGASRFLPGSLAATGAKGKPPAAVPLYSLAYGLYYNKKQFAAAGITDPPKTWDEFVADGKKLTTADHWALALEGGSGTENVHNVFTLSQQQGGAFYDSAGKPTFNTPQNVAAIKQYVDFMQTDKIVNPSDAEYSNGTEALKDFATGATSMVFWQAAQGSLTELGMDPADVGVVPVPLPADPPSGSKPITSMVAGINLAVMKDTASKDAAMAFVKYMTAVPQQQKLNATYGSLPSVKDAYSDPAFQTPNVQVFKQVLSDSAAPLPMVPSESQFETLVGGAVKDLMAQAASGKTVTEQQISSALDAAQQQVGA